MKIFREFPFQVEDKPRAIALGFFDGLHLGHQKLINEMITISKTNNLTATVFTFNDHPESKFKDNFKFPGLIQSFDLRALKLQEMGVDEAFFAPMISQVKEISAYDFFHEYLVGQFRMKALIVGQDARFGHKGLGNVELLKQWTKETDVELIIVGDVKVDAQKISSTLIRQLIETGQIKKANQYLGYNYIIQGKVIHGKKLGRTLGFPTINIIFDPYLVKPRFGVYMSRVKYNDHLYTAITSIGTNPTVSSSSQIKVETFIYDKEIDLYDEAVFVELLDFIRPEIEFDSVQSMKERILLDLELVKKMHQQSND